MGMPERHHWRMPCEAVAPFPPFHPWLAAQQIYQRPLRQAAFVISFRAFFRVPFEMGTDIADSSGSIQTREVNWTTVQIATVISVGVSVAAVASFAFLCYRRRHRRQYHTPSPTPEQVYAMSPPADPHPRPQLLTPGAEPVRVRPPYSSWVQVRLAAPKFFFGLLPGTQTVRSRERKKDPSWEIDDLRPGEDEEGGKAWSHTAQSSYDPGLPGAGASGTFHPLFAEEDENEDAHDLFHSQRSHTRNPSSMSLLALSQPAPSASSSLRRAGQSETPKPDRTFFQRMMKFKRGLLKSPEYRTGRVSPRAPDTLFRIDAGPGEPATPGPSRGGFGETGLGLKQGKASSAPMTQGGGMTVDARARDADERSVLLISRHPGEDFDFDLELGESEAG
ncbi:uncharacterized protein LAESUDRAFT_314765 [Laetiporus sulphureus 93-53]|uniref:Transmembrane protein n=1 Tax=Laetiporus sulphureus 93-53 TaxID=1314785 RepID=A0A165D6B9_9APHY|nr:uncharacterized protein LAESUDRAFT_314765 [Laetiporus sulphureus 93-53]KZT04233.1 hypothetical protein LAESUDRAFT_314765 [Laetiporus sulphureus 93-53]